MQPILVPDVFLGDSLQDASIFFYLRASGPDQIKLKLVYTQNMICFMIHGRKELVDGTEQFQMNNEQIGLVTAGNMLMNERVTLKQEFESLLLFFSNDFLQKFLNKFEINLRSNQVDFTSVLTFPKDDYLMNFQTSMKLLQKDFSKKNFRVAKMEEILLYLVEKYPDKMHGFILRSLSKEVTPIPQIVQSHRYKNLNTEELAFLCNMSLSTFKRKFSDIYNTSPRKYMVSEKMKKAVQLLQRKMRPSDIYYEVGYENLSSFSLEFKKHYGVSPKGYQMASSNH